MMRRREIGDYYDLGNPPVPGMTVGQVTKIALGETLRRLALHLELECARGDTEIPTAIRIEVIQERWDLQVRLHLEGSEDEN